MTQLNAEYTAIGGDPNDPTETECAVTVRVHDTLEKGVDFVVELFEDGQGWHYDDSGSFMKLLTDTLYLMKVDAHKRLWVPIIHEAFDGLVDEIIGEAIYRPKNVMPEPPPSGTDEFGDLHQQDWDDNTSAWLCLCGLKFKTAGELATHIEGYA